jgi:hypothetical protein
MINNGGKHWVQGSISRVLPDGSMGYCSIGAVENCGDGTTRTLALWLLASVAGGDIDAFNDHPYTAWDDVDAAFALAIKHASRFAGAS